MPAPQPCLRQLPSQNPQIPGTPHQAKSVPSIHSSLRLQLLFRAKRPILSCARPVFHPIFFVISILDSHRLTLITLSILQGQFTPMQSNAENVTEIGSSHGGCTHPATNFPFLSSASSTSPESLSESCDSDNPEVRTPQRTAEHPLVFIFVCACPPRRLPFGLHVQVHQLLDDVFHHPRQLLFVV